MSRPEQIVDLRPPPVALRRRELDRAAAAWTRDALRRRMLAIADVATALVGAAVIVRGTDLTLAVVLLAVPVWIVLAKLHGLYDRDHRSLRHLTTDEAPMLVACTLVAAVATGMIVVPLAAAPVPLTTVLWAWLVATPVAFALRSVARWVWRLVTPPERAVIIGDGPLANAARRKLELFADIHVTVVSPATAGGAPSVALLPEADRIIVASEELDEEAVAALIAECRSAGVKLTLVPPACGLFGTAVQLNHVADLPVLEYNTWDVSRSTLLLKRLLDVAVSTTALVALSPVFVLIAIAIKLDSRGPVLFAQLRTGKDGETFRMLKFRSMIANAEVLLPGLVQLDRLPQPAFKLVDDPRVTRVGRFLRRTSLDELPQLVNVVMGDMSLVGPRPEQIEVVERYEPAHRFRLVVKPGLTGPMQVFGRGRLDFDERLSVEREYIENLSLGRDLRILALTLRAVVAGAGAS